MDILERIVSIGSGGTPNTKHITGDYARARGVDAFGIFSMLVREYSADVINEEMVRFLRQMVTAFRSNSVEDVNFNFFACQCCLEMAAEVDEVVLPTELVQDIVRTFPAPFAFQLVGDLVLRYLSRAELLETLVAGLDDLSCQENCLDGFRLYRSADKDGTTVITRQLAEAAQERIEHLCSSTDPQIAEAARTARKHLIGFLSS